jgi:hypothetical protein
VRWGLRGSWRFQRVAKFQHIDSLVPGGGSVPWYVEERNTEPNLCAAGTWNKVKNKLLSDKAPYALSLI